MPKNRRSSLRFTGSADASNANTTDTSAATDAASATAAAAGAVGTTTGDNLRSEVPSSTEAACSGVRDEGRKRARGPFAGFGLSRRTSNGTSKIDIDFDKEKPDCRRPVQRGSASLSLWLGKAIRDHARTPLRRWNSFSDAELKGIADKYKFYYNFIGNRKEDFYKYCFMVMKRALREWRIRIKTDHYIDWHQLPEDQRSPPEGMSASDWADLVAFRDDDKQQEKSMTNKANKAKSKIVHTTGSISFAEFEFQHSTIAEDGSRAWHTTSEAWMLEHTHRTPDGQRQYIDPVSADIYDKIVEVLTQRSACGSLSATSPSSYPTDVVLTQHHNRRVGRGSGYAPLSTRKRPHTYTAEEFERHVKEVLEREREHDRQEREQERQRQEKERERERQEREHGERERQERKRQEREQERKERERQDRARDQEMLGLRAQIEGLLKLVSNINKD